MPLFGLLRLRHVVESVILVLLGVVIIQSCTSTSTPRVPPSAFHGGAHWRLLLPRQSQRQTIGNGKTCGSTPSLSASNDVNIIDKIAKAFGIDRSLGRNTPLSIYSKSNDPQKGQSRVVRTAARPHLSSGGSIPSSAQYTTRKPSLPMISVAISGVIGDYNHYRTTALKSTTNRAISILTRDVSSYIQSLGGGSLSTWESGYRDGDLGENVLVEGVDFRFFRVGSRYRFSTQKAYGGGSGNGAEGVIVEVSEPIEPCANLCKLPYINDASLSSPRERVARCQYFIEALGQKEGLRGWYAKIIQGGVIRVGDSLTAL